MIGLEYIIGQYQSGNHSRAFKSRKPSQENPAVVINRVGNEYIWQLRGLRNVGIQNVPGQPRVTHLDFYIGMDDLNEQRNQFPATRAQSLGIVDGLRIPVGTERAGGTRIRWRGPVGRVVIISAEMSIPPFKMQHSIGSEVIINIDKETSIYPIVSEARSRTTHELHFGIEHDYQVQQSGIIRVPRAELRMNPRQYATILEAIDRAITQHLHP